MPDIHFYFKQLLTAEKNKEAFELFKSKLEKYQKQFTTLMVWPEDILLGNYKTAFKYAQQAQPLTPDNLK